MSVYLECWHWKVNLLILAYEYNKWELGQLSLDKRDTKLLDDSIVPEPDMKMH